MAATERHPSVVRVPLRLVGEFVEVVEATQRGFRSAPHSHAEYVLGVGLTGSHVLVTRGERVVISVGDVIVLPPDLIRAADSIPDVSWSYLMLHVAEGAVRAALGSGGQTLFQGRGNSVVLRDPALAVLLQSTAAALLAADPSAESMLFALIRQCLEPVVLQKPDAAARVDRAVEALLETLLDPTVRSPSLQPTCAKFGVTAFQLIRRFRALKGVPPIAFHTQLRVRRAKQLLIETGSISEAAELGGYSDQSHFSRHFKRVFGMTPGVYLTAYSLRAPAPAPAR